MVQRNPDTGQPIITGDVATLQEEITALGDWVRERSVESLATVADLDTLDYVYPGMMREITADDSVYLYVSESVGWVRMWKRRGTPFATASGVTSNPAGQFKTVALPQGRFTVPPIIHITPLGSLIGIPGVENAATRTNAQFRGALFDPATNRAIASTWMWTAVQMTPTSAEG